MIKKSLVKLAHKQVKILHMPIKHVYKSLVRLLSKHFSTAGKQLQKLNFEFSFETQFLQVSSSIFFACLSRKTLDRFFIVLYHCFYSCKPQICTKQTGLTIRFAIPQKSSGAAFKKSKTNMMVVQMLLFLFLCVLLIA